MAFVAPVVRWVLDRNRPILHDRRSVKELRTEVFCWLKQVSPATIDYNLGIGRVGGF